MDYPAGSHHHAPGLLGASSQAREGGLDSSVGDSVGLAGEHSGLPRVPTTTLIRVRAAQALGPVWSGPNRRRLVCRRGMGSGPHPIPQPAVWPARVARPRLSATRSVWRASDPGRSTTPLLHPWGFPGACSGARCGLGPTVGDSICRRGMGTGSHTTSLFCGMSPPSVAHTAGGLKAPCRSPYHFSGCRPSLPGAPHHPLAGAVSEGRGTAHPRTASNPTHRAGT